MNEKKLAALKLFLVDWREREKSDDGVMFLREKPVPKRVNFNVRKCLGRNGMCRITNSYITDSIVLSSWKVCCRYFLTCSNKICGY